MIKGKRVLITFYDASTGEKAYGIRCLFNLLRAGTLAAEWDYEPQPTGDK